MTRLNWRDAEYRDRAALNAFRCCPPVAQRKFGRAAPPRDHEWERLAQGAIRNTRPPAKQGQHILIGEDRRGIGAVACVEDDEGSSVVFVSAMAVALRLRRKGAAGKVGDELIRELVDRLASRADAAGHERLVLWGWVDPRNHACRDLCARLGAQTLECVEGLDRWIMTVIFEDPPEPQDGIRIHA